MQDRYTGDLGDFGKYGLLRALCALGNDLDLKLGVVWYLAPNETHNNDGKHIGYLQNPTKASVMKLRNCDPRLYDVLRKLFINNDNNIVSERRMVATVEKSGLLPAQTAFYSAPLSYARGTSTVERLKLRRNWFEGALQATAFADLVFLDPDNGIECESKPRTSPDGPKYVYWDEIGSFVDRGQSVVVYHHFNRLCPSAEQVERLKLEFKKRMPDNVETSVVIYRRGTRRAYFVVTPAKYQSDFAAKLSQLLIQWDDHFVGPLTNHG